METTNRKINSQLYSRSFCMESNKQVGALQAQQPVSGSPLVAQPVPSPETISPAVRDAIEATLQEIEAKHDVRILFACESGSRAWGFSSPDSDYDVRFMYVHRLAWYLQVGDRRDVIEMPIAADLDVSGWELRKTLQLMKKGNAAPFEWLRSPIVYRCDENFMAAVQDACERVHTAPRAFFHYYHLAKGQFQRHCLGEEVRLKKLLYVLRPVLAAMWVEQGRGIPPMLFGELVDAMVDDPALEAAIQEVLQAKRAALESDKHRSFPIIIDFLAAQLERLASVTLASPRGVDFAVLDDVLLTYATQAA